MLYVSSANHELQYMMEATPCPYKDALDVTVSDQGFWRVPIGHESAFSSVPYEVYAREYGCLWDNFISTDLEPLMANSGGFDAIRDSQKVYWNLTLPEHSFFYVQSTAKEFPLDEENRTYEIIAKDDGIWLLYVNRVQENISVEVEIEFR